ncbi:MAG: tRNA (N6-threonylcarbamoyladenosine(37)-N6)-methyltransferase TrmO [Pseudoflavonifractor sp.]
MPETVSMKIIAKIHSDFTDKFGIPRQSGLVEALRATVVFEPEYRNADALRGLEGYSHIWLIWNFSESARDGWSPTVRPPRLGGNARRGVFATRSPFRPNPLGLSSVRLEGIRQTEQGTVLDVSGADLLDGTPIFDIKPYLPYVDCHSDAVGGFASGGAEDGLTVNFPPALLERVPERLRPALGGILACDPRPRYQEDTDRVYGLSFGGVNVRFTVAAGVLTVREVAPKEQGAENQ